MELDKKIKFVLSDPKMLSIIMFAVLIGSKTVMTLGGGQPTNGDVVG
jgi:hypothetical protein